MDLVRFISCIWLLVVVTTATTSGKGIAVDVREQPLVPNEQLKLSSEHKTTKAVNNAQEPQIEIMELAVNEDEMNELMALHTDIEREALETATDSMRTPQSDTERSSRALVDSAEEKTSVMLSDEDITKLVQMISFPSEAKEDGEVKQTSSPPELATVQEVAQVQVEPRNNRLRYARALNSRGYYILAFSPIDSTLRSAYTKLDIIPAERALEGDLAVKRANKRRNGDDLLMSGSEVNEEARLLSKKKFKRYVRKLMKQIRKGTRKIQRKTRFKSKSAEPTVENFLRKLYSQSKAQKPKKSVWFSWK